MLIAVTIGVICLGGHVQQHVQGTGLVDIVSRYAKVRTSEPQLANNAARNITEVSKMNDTVEYDDFDELEAAQDNRTSKATSDSSSFTADKMMRYFNGVINMLALMYNFNGNQKSVKPESLHFGPRKNDLAEDVNGLQEAARFHPTTATQKFLKKEAEMMNQMDKTYQPIDTFPPYDPNIGSEIDPYKSGGKTSYDADREQYQTKTPMKDYMSQNDDNFDIQKSYGYSYDIPPEYQHSYQPWAAGQSGQSTWQAQQYGPTDTQAMEDDEDGPPQNPRKPMKEDTNYGVPPLKPPKNEYPAWNYADGYVTPAKRPIYGPDDSSMKRPIYSPDDSSMKRPVYGPDDSSMKRPVYSPDDSSMKRPIYGPDDSPMKWRVPQPEKYHHDEEPMDDDGQTPPKHGVDHYPVYLHADHPEEYIFEDGHKDKDKDKDMEEEHREGKYPYSYYFLERKLWYVPLLFSVYFIIYIGALILKAIGKHKIQLPEKLWALHDSEKDPHGSQHRRNRHLEQLADTVQTAVHKYNSTYKYM